MDRARGRRGGGGGRGGRSGRSGGRGRGRSAATPARGGGGGAAAAAIVSPPPTVHLTHTAKTTLSDRFAEIHRQQRPATQTAQQRRAGRVRDTAQRKSDARFVAVTAKRTNQSNDAVRRQAGLKQPKKRRGITVTAARKAGKKRRGRK